MTRFRPLALSVLLALPAAAQEADPRLFDTLAGLSTIEVAEEEVAIPPVARAHLGALKEELRDLLLRCASGRGGACGARWGEEVQACVATLLRASEPRLAEGVDPSYALAGMEVKSVEGHPDLLVATATIAVPCGEDVSLFVVRRRGSAVHLVHADAAAMEELADGRHDLEYRLSPPEPGREPLLLVVSSNPRCMSNWQSIRWSLTRLGEAAPLASGQDGLYAPDGWRLALSEREARITWTVHHFDPELWARTRIVHLEIEGEDAVRTDPVAGEPTGFLAEWLALPWSEAALLTDEASREGLRGWHDVLDEEVGPCCYSAQLASLEEVAAPGGARRHRIELAIEPGDCAGLPSCLVFTIAGREGGVYRMVDVAPGAAPCVRP